MSGVNVSPTVRRIVFWVVAVVAALLILLGSYWGRASYIEVVKVKATLTAVIATLVQPKATSVPATATLVPTGVTVAPATSTPIRTATVAVSSPTLVAASSTPGADVGPYPSAPMCLDVGEFHNTSLWHGLWNAAAGCHYDQEHGISPFTTNVASTFPGFDLRALLGGVQIGHTNPSSPRENTDKHGGMKWQVDLDIPCVSFESAQWCVTDAAIQYHWFGDSGIEMNARVHSLLALVKACNPANVTDCGTLFVVQHVDFGQRVSQYQGDLMTYPDNPAPAYDAASGPYFTIDRFGTCAGCRVSLQAVVNGGYNSNGTWTSKNTGTHDSLGSPLLSALIRNRDMYQLLDYTTQFVYPHTFGWLCSSDGGGTYNPAACRYTNSTARVHELAGIVPAAWDNLAGFDTNETVGRITAEGYVTRFGNLTGAGACAVPGAECFPIKMNNFFVGHYGGAMPGQKISNPSPVSNPSRNVWFCAGLPCAETAPGATPSGWIGPNN